MGRPNKLFSTLIAIVVALVGIYGGVKLTDNGDSGSATIEAVGNDGTFTPGSHDGSNASSGNDATTDPTAVPTDQVEEIAKISDPLQAQAVASVLRMIASGEKLPYDQDGAVFENREGNLPDLPPGEEYHEYTVPTPGSPDRGARRLVISTEGDVYYTADHYDTFTQLNG